MKVKKMNKNKKCSKIINEKEFDRYEKFKNYEQEFELFMKSRKDFKVYKENEERFKDFLYKIIFDEFMKHIDDFEKYMGYGKTEIDKIGYKKFIEKMGWTDESQVLSWKTDRAHIVPCVECNNDFAIFEMDFGLCDKCKKKYDLTKIQAFLEASFNAGDMNKYLLDVAMVTQSQEVRDNFLKEAN